MKLTKHDIIFASSNNKSEMLCTEAAKKFDVPHGTLGFYCRSGQVEAKKKLIKGQLKWFVNLQSLKERLKKE